MAPGGEAYRQRFAHPGSPVTRRDEPIPVGVLSLAFAPGAFLG
jgi:hypothetical protein